MDNIRFRLIFDLGRKKEMSGKKHIKISKTAKFVLRNVVKYGKHCPAKLANLYTFVLRAEISN